MEDLDFGETIKGFNAGQKVFNRFTLKKILGRGGMGVVWLARDEELERDVALKFLPEVVALDREAVADLKRETRRNLELTHPHIVRIYDFVSDHRSAAISMEYVDGASLSALKLDQPGRVFSPGELTPWVQQLCTALAYAHGEAQVVHRDLKPANLMVDTRGRLKITDFGIARGISDSVSRVSAQAGSSGTPLYMSPQQMLGEKPSVSDDIYSLGATIYELLTGKPPFYSGNVLLQVQMKVPPPLSIRRKELEVSGEPVPAHWETTIAACLAKEATDRPQSAADVAERLGLAAVAAGGKELGAGRKAQPAPAGPAVAVAEPPPLPPPAAKTVPPSAPKRGGSKAALYVALAVVLLAGLGYYFGVYAPEQQRQAEAARQRMEEERLQAEHLAAARGALAITTEPAGAEVQVGALAMEKSPVTLKDQKLGKYPVRVRLDGYDDWTGEIEVKENDFTRLNVPLVRSQGSVGFSSDPVGARVIVNGGELHDGVFTNNKTKQEDVTPFRGNLPTGEYTVRFELKGYQPQTKTVKVLAKGTVELAASLEKFQGPEEGREWTVPGIDLAMVSIAAGTFTLGSPADEEGRSADEGPQLEVTLTQGFWLGKYPVTQAQWTALMGSNPSKSKGDDLPVESVSWEEAMEFCRKLTEQERAAGRLPDGYAYTLPTEAEWEYAARAGTTTRFYLGDAETDLARAGWYDGNSGNVIHPVGQKEANAWGVYDMHGNVWQWCLDWYSRDYSGYPDKTRARNPTGPTAGKFRVFRGGGAINAATACRSAYRNRDVPGHRGDTLGFRLALAPEWTNPKPEQSPQTASADQGAAYEKPREPLHLAYGQEVRIEDYLVPGKTTIFDFFSDYCPPCRAFAPRLLRVHQTRDDVVVVRIDINRPGVNGIDWKSPVAAQYNIQSVPYLKIYGPDGKLVEEGDSARAKVEAWAYVKPAEPLHLAYGQQVRIENYLAPGKTTIFDFFSDYCPPCRAFSPLLLKLHQNRDDIVVVRIDINRPDFKGIDWKSPVATQYNLQYVPYLKIYGPDGSLLQEGDEARTKVDAWIKDAN